MRKYLSYFKIKFLSIIQYRNAALFGVITQLVWGLFEIFLFKALFSKEPNKNGISLNNMVTYIWLQQALFQFYMLFGEDKEIYESIENGNILLDIVKPINLYDLWFSRNLGQRLSRGILRCIPMIIIAFLLPTNYRLSLPFSLIHFLLFIVSLILTIFLVISLNMIMISIVIRIINSNGIRLISFIILDFLQGSEIPLYFYPEALRKILEYLPTGNMLYTTNRIYFGEFDVKKSIIKILIQLTWFLILYLLGKYLLNRSIKKVIVQGG